MADIHPSLMREGFTPKLEEPLGDLLARRGFRAVSALENVLMGARMICKYMRVADMKTLQRWHDDYGLPLTKTMDGKWMTTTTAIDQWIWLSSELSREGRRLTANNKQVIKAIAGLERPRPATQTYTSSDIERGERRGRSADEVIAEAGLKRMAKGYNP